MKTIGLIGGMSWESAAHYYAAINKLTAQRLGGLHSAPMIIHSVDFAPIAESQAAGDWDGAGEQLAECARKLEAAGAEIVGIATNTMHMVFEQVQSAVSVPVLHIATPTANALREDGFETIGLLGTRFTLELPFYKDQLLDMGLEVIVPDVDVTSLNGIIFEELCKGIVREQSQQTYLDAIARLQARGAEAIILGCTELNMLISDEVSPLPIYDTTTLHAKALVDAALTP